MLFLLMVLKACVSFCAVGRTFHPAPSRPLPLSERVLTLILAAGSPPALFLRVAASLRHGSAGQERLSFLGSQRGPGRGWRVDFRPPLGGDVLPRPVLAPSSAPGWLAPVFPWSWWFLLFWQGIRLKDLGF